MRWDAAADRQLLIFGFGREIRTEEYKILAERFEQKPTVKAIQERITKLRVEVRRVLKETGIFDPERVAQSLPRDPATPGQDMSSPAQPSAKNAKKDRPASGGAKTKGSRLPPDTGSPAPRSQQGLPSAQPPSVNPPPGPIWGTHHPLGWPATANMYGPFERSPRPTGSQMGMPPMGRPPYVPYGAIPPIMFQGTSNMSMSQYQQQQQRQLHSFNPGDFTPSLLSQQPTGADVNPPVPNTGDAAEGEEEDPMARSERELKEKRAKREAVSERHRSPLMLKILY
jgi:hypothetical protein